MDDAFDAAMARLKARIAENQSAEADESAGKPRPSHSPASPSPFTASVDEGNDRPARILDGLNPAQREAVTHEGGPLLVVAGAGSGKTRVLTSRIAYLIATGRAAPGEVLAITFTNKAAKEMRERLDAMLGGIARSMWISTFHSACVRILREQHETLGIRSTFTIYDAADAQRLMKMVCQSENIDVRALTPKALVRKVSDLKNELITPSMAEAEAHDRDSMAVARAYAAYQARLAEAHAMDFDDLIMRTVQLFQAYPTVRDYYRTRFRHVLVDEYQDTNHAQYVLVRELASGEEGSTLTVVGDADQSIYAFRGATIRNIEEFEKDFPHARSVLLEQNYRSTQSILSAANAVIANNAGRRAKNLWTDRGAGEKLIGYVADSEADEAQWVVDTIDRLRDESDASYKDVAIFYRTNSQSRALEEMFVRAGIPYIVVGGTKFYERREIKDALAYMHAVANPDDTVSMRRIINTPRRGVGAKAEDAVLAHAARLGMSYGAALEDVAHPNPQRSPVEGLAARAQSSIEGFVAVLNKGREMAEAGEAPADILDEVLEESGYLAALRASNDPQDEVRLDNLAELHSVASDYRLANPDATLADWLADVALVADSDQLPDETDSEGEVTLMTVHTAKGLEFPIVFVTGLEDGTFPHMRSLASEAELAEERRLAYVALTRAQRRLFLSRAAVRSAWGAPQHFPPSRFLEEIPSELVAWEREESSMEGLSSAEHARGYRRRESSWGGEDDFAPAIGAGSRRTHATPFKPGKLGAPTRTTRELPEESAAGAGAGGLNVGDRVRHKSFGTGTVLSFEGEGKSTVAKVRFASGQTKRLMLRYAPLEKIG